LFVLCFRIVFTVFLYCFYCVFVLFVLCFCIVFIVFLYCLYCVFVLFLLCFCIVFTVFFIVFTVFLYCLYCVYVLFRLCIFILICFDQPNCSNNNNNNKWHWPARDCPPPKRATCPGMTGRCVSRSATNQCRMLGEPRSRRHLLDSKMGGPPVTRYSFDRMLGEPVCRCGHNGAQKDHCIRLFNV